MEAMLAALVRGEQVDWPFTGAAAERQFLDAAREHGVLPLVARQQRRLGSLNNWPATLREAIATRARQHAIVEQLHRAELTAVVGELTSRGVRPIVFKGAALAYTHYPHPCLRPREDFDLLVPESQKNDAVEALRARAYAPLEMVTGRLVTSQQTFARDAGLGVRHTCDLHWQVSNRAAFSRLLPWERLAAETRPIPALDADGLTPPHALLMACLHRVAHHFDPPTLIWLYDIHLLVSSMSDEEAARFVALAVDSGLATICVRGIALAQHHFRTPLPAALEQLVPAGREPLAALPARAVSSLRRVDVGPACVAQGIALAASCCANTSFHRPTTCARPGRGWVRGRCPGCTRAGSFAARRAGFRPAKEPKRGQV